MHDDSMRDAGIEGERLAKMLHEGARSVPQERPLLVCKPARVESWRIFKILSEFVEGFDIIRRYGLAATFFGSARTKPGDPFFKDAEELAKRLSKKGFAIVTGGSSGIMQAGNKGAFEVGGASVGLNIDLPTAQDYNPYLTDRFSFDHFFVRKVMLVYASEIYIYFPGGIGTLDEFFELLTLVQTKKIRKVPIVLYGKKFWEPFVTLMRTQLLEEYSMIDAADLDLFTVVDSVDEAFDYIVANVSC